ncbi:hypothetical protein G6F56_008309 [Rhizopus delemar]|nr:hypothetical protein G6F56_008309 [Rhizopus delemar]
MLKFSPINSAVDASFWQTLASKKLNLFQLSKDPVDIHASYTPILETALNQQGQKILLPSHLSVPADGLEQM